MKWLFKVMKIMGRAGSRQVTKTRGRQVLPVLTKVPKAPMPKYPRATDSSKRTSKAANGDRLRPWGPSVENTGPRSEPTVFRMAPKAGSPTPLLGGSHEKD